MQGRKKQSSMDLMRTQVWLAEMMRVTGSENPYQLGDLIDDVDTTTMLYRYAKGENGISKKKLVAIDDRIRQSRPNHVNGQSFFHIGPESARASCGFAPLWDALDGSMEKVSDALVALDPAIGIQKYLGDSFLQRCSYLIYPIFNEYDPPAYWKETTHKNRVAESYSNGELTVDIDLITFAIAAWRMAHFMGELQQMMNYILIGLLDRAIPETFDQMYKIKLDKPTNATYTITTKLLDCLEALSKKDIEDAEDAIKDLNYWTPGYPVTEIVNGRAESVGDEQAHDFRFLIDQVKPTSVFEYLAQRKKRLETTGTSDEVGSI
ncbi:MAG: hypothetical protein PHC51_14500 [bacterium]|nr:hypothetical protein [bacterium]